MNHVKSSHLAHGEEKEVTYPGLVQFALSLTDSLLFVHYLALILIEIRHRRAQYYVKVRNRESHATSTEMCAHSTSDTPTLIMVYNLQYFMSGVLASC